jgi:hypothetical protein
MGKSIIFTAVENSKSQDSQIEVMAILGNEIFINIEDVSGLNGFIHLDRKTAIQFSRELKRQISFLNLEEEVNNG